MLSSSPEVYIIFAMADPGNYNVLSYLDGNGVNTCPSVAPGDVVILTEVGVVCLAVPSF